MELGMVLFYSLAAGCGTMAGQRLLLDERDQDVENKDGLGAITFDRDTTIRWSFRYGDVLIWLRIKGFSLMTPTADYSCLDFWMLQDSDFATLTNRFVDLPAWFRLHPDETANALAYRMREMLTKGYNYGDTPLDGPNIWRVLTGDRIAWVGTPRQGVKAVDGVLSIVEFISQKKGRH
jgi:hypothetical protein